MGPLIHLALINHIYLLRDLYKEVVITEGVRGEVAGKVGSPDAVLIEKAISEGWIKAVDYDYSGEYAQFGLHPAEAAVISYALEEKFDLVLLDDDPARELARSLGLEVRGSIGVIVEALKKGILTKKKALSILDELTEVMYLSSTVYKLARKTIESIE